MITDQHVHKLRTGRRRYLLLEDRIRLVSAFKKTGSQLQLRVCN